MIGSRMTLLPRPLLVSWAASLLLLSALSAGAHSGVHPAGIEPAGVQPGAPSVPATAPDAAAASPVVDGNALPATNATPPRGTAPGQRPRVGLVLSGGGARGGAHLGVLRVLEANNVPIDVIVGTSAGSIIGAAYASGLGVDDIERILQGLSTSKLFQKVDRTEVPIRRKTEDANNYIGAELGYGPQGLGLPKGALASVSLESVLREITARSHTNDFDQLPIPFRAIATDLATSEMVVLGSGNLAAAVRASMAIPGAVTPVELGDRLLVDGGLVRNLPVDVARSMGAEVIIAVDVGTPLRKREEITSLLGVVDQVTNILTATNVRASLEQLTERDVLITPDLSTVATLDFDKMLVAADLGNDAALIAVPRLAALSTDAASYSRWQQARTAGQSDGGLRVASIEIRGAERVNQRMIEATMDTEVGQPFERETAERDMQRLFGRGDFERASYTLEDVEGGAARMIVDLGEKSWGPHLFRAGLSLSSDFGGDSFFNLAVSHRLANINALGAEWRNDLQTGRITRVNTEYYQPLTLDQRPFATIRAGYRDEPYDIYTNDGARVATYRRESREGELALGWTGRTDAELRAGVIAGRVRLLRSTSVLPGSQLLPTATIGGLFAQAQVDTLDDLRFPRSGYAGIVRYQRTDEALGSTDEYSKVSGNARIVRSFGPHTLELGARLELGLDDYDLPLYELSALGGFLRLSGYETGELLGNDVRYGRLVYRYNIVGPGLLDGAFIGVSAEAGRVDRPAFEVEPGLQEEGYGGSVFLAFDTPLGPIYLAYARASGGRQAAYLFLGQP